MQHSNFCTLHWLCQIDWLIFTDRPAPRVGSPPPTGSSRERSHHRRCSFLSRVRSRCCPTWLEGMCSSVRCTHSGRITVLWSAVFLWEQLDETVHQVRRTPRHVKTKLKALDLERNLIVLSWPCNWQQPTSYYWLAVASQASVANSLQDISARSIQKVRSLANHSAPPVPKPEKVMQENENCIFYILT
jgi:hypothetical protein